MSPTLQDGDISSSLNKLSLNKPKVAAKPTKKKLKEVVADSWEDEDLSDSEPEPAPKADEEERQDDDIVPTPKQPPASSSTHFSPVGSSWSTEQDASVSRGSADSSRRPEKTDAVARRMIVAGLGLKAPKLTEEQRAYQRSVREQEKKRREQEKAAEQKAKEDAEKAKASVWED
ncbi:hypothetical protein B0J13DRAFT_549493 [Dactylonectria estremocensis]|uniref:Uncharacterized protein n=1 Tax=Dactylonectria estremocensis TaxID=1079267 RepID=A0A9P9F1H6_9HYPO|nr:hypothetical protein B0J13DRAFT_549493 [Dactylonectria estremocensis]